MGRGLWDVGFKGSCGDGSSLYGGIVVDCSGGLVWCGDGGGGSRLRLLMVVVVVLMDCSWWLLVEVQWWL